MDSTVVPENQRVTFVVTSCGRFDLLHRTLVSFLAHNTYPISEYILVEDSGNEEGLRVVLSDFSHIQFKTIINPTRRGQIPSIDSAYSLVRTPYIFHCEDDWLFRGKSCIEPSLNLLENFDNVLQVWLRNPLKAIVPRFRFRPSLNQHNGIAYYDWKNPDPYYHHFTFNPGLRRLSDYRKISSYTSIGRREGDISCHYHALGYRLVTLVYSSTVHIGRRRRTLASDDPYAKYIHKPRQYKYNLWLIRFLAKMKNSVHRRCLELLWYWRLWRMKQAKKHPTDP